jgi:hypothetical protein
MTDQTMLNPYIAFSRRAIPKIKNLYPNQTKENYLKMIKSLWKLCNEIVDTEITNELIKQSYDLCFNKNVKELVKNKYPNMKSDDVERMQEKLIKCDITDETMHQALIMIIMEDPKRMFYLNDAVEIMCFVQEKSKHAEFVDKMIPIISNMYPTLKQNCVLQIVNNIWTLSNQSNESECDIIKKGFDMFLEKIEI